MGFTHGADLRGLNLAIFEQHQGRDAAHGKLARGAGVLVDVDFDHLDFAVVAIGDVIHQWADHFARAAPFGPKIHQHRRGRFQNVSIEAGIGNVVDFIAHKRLLEWGVRRVGTGFRVE